MPRKLTKILSFFLCFLLIFEQSGFAQVAGELDISGHFLQLRNSLLPDKFRPLHLRYLSYDTLNNNFKLLLDKGDFLKGLSPSELKGTVSKGTVPEEKLKEQTKTLLNYFFIGISLPNDSFWVNLRPDSPENIIDPYLAQTDVGKILLEADLQLKKDTAQFTSPETPKGKEYWEKLYKKAGELFGSENITIPTLTRPWIVPGEIIIRETPDNAYIYKATLKVMLEQDYLKDSAVYSFQDERLKALNEYSSELIRELIIPKLTKEVNNAQRYAPLRQVYYSLILAQWFKARFYGKSGLYSSLIDRKNLNGLASKDPWSKTAYFEEYKKSFAQGEYNLKEPVYTPFGQTIRSYMSGGMSLVSIGEQISSSPLKPGEMFTRGNFLTEIGGLTNRELSAEGKVRINVEGTTEPFSVKVTTSSPLVESQQPPVSSAVEKKPSESSSPASNTFIIINELARLNTLYSNGLNRNSIQEMGLNEMHGNILRNTTTGKTILIMGKSGSGKTFLSYLLAQSSGGKWEFLADDWLLGKIFYIKDKAFLLVGFNSSLYAGSELIKYRTGPGNYDFRFIPLHSKKEFVNIDHIVNLESTGLEHKDDIGGISINTLSRIGIPIATFKKEEQYSDRLYFEGIVSELSRNFGSSIAASPLQNEASKDRSLIRITSAGRKVNAAEAEYSADTLSQVMSSTSFNQPSAQIRYQEDFGEQFLLLLEKSADKAQTLKMIRVFLQYIIGNYYYWGLNREQINAIKSIYEKIQDGIPTDGNHRNKLLSEIRVALRSLGPAIFTTLMQRIIQAAVLEFEHQIKYFPETHSAINLISPFSLRLSINTPAPVSIDRERSIVELNLFVFLSYRHYILPNSNLSERQEDELYAIHTSDELARRSLQLELRKIMVEPVIANILKRSHSELLQDMLVDIVMILLDDARLSIPSAKSEYLWQLGFYGARRYVTLLRQLAHLPTLDEKIERIYEYLDKNFGLLQRYNVSPANASLEASKKFIIENRDELKSIQDIYYHFRKTQVSVFDAFDAFNRIKEAEIYARGGEKEPPPKKTVTVPQAEKFPQTIQQQSIPWRSWLGYAGAIAASIALAIGAMQFISQPKDIANQASKGITAVSGYTGPNVYRKASAKAESTQLRIQSIVEPRYGGFNPLTHLPSSDPSIIGYGNTVVEISGNLFTLSGYQADEMFITGRYNAVGNGGYFTQEGQIKITPEGNPTSEEVQVTITLASMAKGSQVLLPTILNGEISPASFADGKLSLGKDGVVTANEDTRPTTITYRILKWDQNGRIQATQPVTEWMRREFQDFPAEIKEELDRARLLSAQERLNVIARLLNQKFAYSTNQHVELSAGTWNKFLNDVLQKNERFVLDCDVSSMFAFLFIRYVSLNAVFVMGFSNADGDQGIDKNKAHGKLIVDIDGKWLMFETTVVMPKELDLRDKDKLFLLGGMPATQTEPLRPSKHRVAEFKPSLGEEPKPQLPLTYPEGDKKIYLLDIDILRLLNESADINPGDVLTRIGEKYYGNGSIEIARLIAEHNRISDAGKIYAGRPLNLPPLLTHIVKEGETLSGIARDYHLKEEELARINFDINFSPRRGSIIYPGEKIVVAKRKVLPEPTSSSSPAVKKSAPSAVSGKQSAASSPAATGYQQAMTQLNEFIDAIKKGKYQQKAVVDLRNLPPGVEVILVGDLHARLDNLKRILNNNDNLKKIQRGEAILVILGDAVHSETNLEEMDSSVEIMRFIMKLKIENRHSVYYLLGNHDYLSSLEMKDGVQQGLLYWDKLEYLYGTGGYIDSYDNFIKASPLMAIGNGFIATHAGPIKGATYREIQDVDVANEESDIVRQAERGRYGERFGEEDIRKFLHNMGQPEEASLIVGHSPTRDGDWHWQPLPNSHFHIIFAGHDRAGYAYIQNGRLDFTEVTNVSPNLELADSAASPVRGKQLKGAESTSSPVVSAPAKFTFFKEGNSYRKAEIRRLSQLTREEIPGARKGLLKLSEVLSGHMLAVSNIATELNNSEPFTSLDAFILTDTSNPDAWVIYALEEFRDYGNRRDLLLWLSSSILPDNHISIAGNQILAYAVQDALDNNMELKISHALGDRQRRAGLIKDINSRDGLSGFLRRHFYNLEGELAKNQGADGAEEFLQAIRRGGVNMTASSPSIPQQEGKGEIDVSTPLSIDAQQSDKGGIDFRGLPIVTQPIGSSPLGTAPLVGQVRPMAGTVPSLNLDKEWRQIENMAQAGLIPSNERIREYLQASCQSEDCSQRIDKVLSLFADILRLEEERVSSTEPALKDILALLESDKAAAELQVALSKIEVLAQEPQLIEQ